MSCEYDLYLVEHRYNVSKSYQWLKDKCPELFENGINYDQQIMINHDFSKNDPEEYAAYDNWFYGNNKSYSAKEMFNYAWLHHIHNNPHHWQYWVLINDDQKEGDVALEIPMNYLIEMICDWWSFSWKDGNLGEIFDWYDAHKSRIKLAPNTKKIVEDILKKIKEKI